MFLFSGNLHFTAAGLPTHFQGHQSFNPSCAATNFSQSDYFAHILQMPLHVVVLYNQQTKVACGSTDQHFAVSRTLCMIMVKDKLFIEHNIFHQVCFTLLRPEVGVAPQCVLVCVQITSRSKPWIRSRSTATD